MDTTFDTRMMARALQLARRGRYSTMPNPHVGCVLVRDGEVIGEGFTQPAGGNHAEIEALQAAVDRDADYVVMVTEPTPFGLNDLKLAAANSDEQIRNDVVLIWVGQRRIITGTDILARLLTGIGSHRYL